MSATPKVKSTLNSFKNPKFSIFAFCLQQLFPRLPAKSWRARHRFRIRCLYRLPGPGSPNPGRHCGVSAGPAIFVSLSKRDHYLPRHPNYYKSQARALILLSSLDPRYLQIAADTLQKAIAISPTDPRIPYNLGIIYKYLNATPSSILYLQASLKLKPDFFDAQDQLSN